MRTKQYIKEINKFSSKLSKENEDKFDKILLTMRFSGIMDNDAEEFSHHCLDLFLQAEEQNKPIEEILNTNDIDLFCNNFIEETKSSYSFFKRIYLRLEILPIILFIFTGIWEMLVGYLIKAWVNKETIFTVPFTLSMLVDTILATLLTYILFANTYRLYSTFNSNDKKKDRIATFILWLGFCLLIGFFVLSKLFLNTVLFNVNYLIFMGVLGAILLIQYFIDNRKN